MYGQQISILASGLSIPQISMSFEVAERRTGFICVVTLSGGAVRTNSFQRNLDRTMTDTEPNPCLIQNVTALSKSPTCGNGICEIGEANGVESEYLCPEDCHFSFTMCPFRGEDGIVGDASLPCSGNGANKHGMTDPSASLCRALLFCPRRPL